LKLIAVGCAALIGACQTTDITTLEDQSISLITPSAVLDTSFVGDTVVFPLPFFITSGCTELGENMLELYLSDKLFEKLSQCNYAGNFDLNWTTTNAAVSTRVGGAAQHVDVTNKLQYVKTASVGLGEAQMSFTSNVPFRLGAGYVHKIVVLPLPDRLEVHDIIVIGVGETTLLIPSVRAGTGPGITTGAIVWGPSTAVASIVAADTVLKAQTDGRLVTRSNSVLLVKGLAQGQVTVPVAFKKNVSFLDAGSVLSAPAMFQKNVTILVGASVRIVANPIGPQNDASNATVPLAIGSTRQYRLFDQNDAVVANSSVQWLSTPSTTASIDANGLAKCLAAGTATIKATKTGTPLTATTTVICAVPAPPAPTITVNPIALALQVGEAKTATATVVNFSGTSPVVWTSKDPTIVSVSPANVAPSASGSPTTLTGVKAGGPVDVVASYTLNGVTVTSTVAVTVSAAPSGNGVVAMYLDPTIAEYTAKAGNFYRARLLNGQGGEVTASSDGGVIRYFSDRTSVVVIDSVSGLATIDTVQTSVRTATITAIYRKNGQTALTATSPLTVYVSGGTDLGAVQFSVAGDARRITVGQTIQFQIIARDQTGIQQTSQTVRSALEVTSSSSSSLEVTPVSSTSFFFNMTAKALPASSALAGIPNVVLIKADINGAMTTIPIIIMP
jgi:hypothetical protein